MKTPLKLAAPFLLFLLLLIIYPFQDTNAQQAAVSPTPTYDPLDEPPLPEHPTEYELGRNLYWHWCMTCHGDVGQGLTDEFRGIWEEDHQDCWGRGCHAGHPGDMGFPIPTVVPALVSDAHLEQFACMQELSAFLKATHPPQSPGILKDEEYHAIALFVFTMNERPLIDFAVTEPSTPYPTLTSTPAPVQKPKSDSFPTFTGPAVALIAVVIILWFAAKRLRGRSHLDA
jgi:cytochrome c